MRSLQGTAQPRGPQLSPCYQEGPYLHLYLYLCACIFFYKSVHMYRCVYSVQVCIYTHIYMYTCKNVCVYAARVPLWNSRSTAVCRMGLWVLIPERHSKWTLCGRTEQILKSRTRLDPLLVCAVVIPSTIDCKKLEHGPNDLCWCSFVFRLWGWTIVIFQLSGCNCDTEANRPQGCRQCQP